jgi:hypothetical protein
LTDSPNFYLFIFFFLKILNLLIPLLVLFYGYFGTTQRGAYITDGGVFSKPQTNPNEPNGGRKRKTRDGKSINLSFGSLVVLIRFFPTYMYIVYVVFFIFVFFIFIISICIYNLCVRAKWTSRRGDTWPVPNVFICTHMTGQYRK